MIKYIEKLTKSQPAKLCETFVKNGFRGKNLLPTEPFLYYNLTNSNWRAQMDVVAGKGGNFFVVTGRVNNVILGMLSEISYDEFARYNAYSTMKKISRNMRPKTGCTKGSWKISSVWRR